jgi:chromosome partitioning protein
MHLTVANLKGGTGKTTTAVHLALGLSRAGRTLLVDADRQASAFAWSELAEDFPLTVVPWASRDLARRIEQVAGDYAHVVVDTPPQHEDLVRQALLGSDLLVVPLAPSAVEVARLGPTFALAAEVELERPLQTRVLLNRSRAGTRSRQEVRALLAERGVPAFASEVRLREAYAAVFGDVPRRLLDFQGVLCELTRQEGMAPT